MRADRRYRSHLGLPPVAATGLLPVVLIALAAGCSPDGGPGAAAGAWLAEVDTIGDTIVVRTISGSERGMIAPNISWSAPSSAPIRNSGTKRAGGFSTQPYPVFRGEHVCSTERDELGVQYLVRYRIDRGDGPG